MAFNYIIIARVTGKKAGLSLLEWDVCVCALHTMYVIPPLVSGLFWFTKKTIPLQTI